MNVALRKRMSLEEFLAWEARQELRYEFDGLQPVAMTGGTRTHSRLERNLAISVGGRLAGTACEFLGSNFQIKMQDSIRYPDGAVFCTRGEGRDKGAHDPVVVFKILSASTDRITKNREYQATPSIQRYVMLEQDRVAATVFARAGEDWVGHVLTGDEALHMPEIGVELPLSELYADIDLEPEPDGDAG